MNIEIDRNSITPIYMQIADKFYSMINKKEIPDGYKLPSERQLAKSLGVHRNTVVKAYETLISSGLVRASRESPRGYFVSVGINRFYLQNDFFPLKDSLIYHFDSKTLGLKKYFELSDAPGYISFAGLVIKNRLPFLESFCDIPRKMFCDGCDFGYYMEQVDEFKNHIINILAQRKLFVDQKNIQICTEDSNTLNILFDMYMEPGDYLLAEEPLGSENAGLIVNKGINLVTVPMEQDGVNIEKLEIAIKHYKPRVFYTIPSNHNPINVTTSYEKRCKIVELCAENNVIIIEHDWMSWYNFSENRQSSLYMIDHANHGKNVIYLDAFSLMLPYGFQLGYILGPEETVEMMGAISAVTSKVIGNLGIYYMNDLIESGKFEEYVMATRQFCQEKCELATNTLDKISHLGLTYTKPNGGLHIWCTIDSRINQKKFFELLLEKKVLVIPGKYFYGHDITRSFRLCFTNVTDEELKKGIELIGEALKESSI